MFQRITVFVFLLTMTCAAQAHDLWIIREAQGYVLQSGHRTSDHHHGDRKPEYDYPSDFVTRAICLDSTGHSRSLPTNTVPFEAPATCVGLFIQASSGFWTKTPFETVNRPRTEVSQAVDSWLSIEYVKRIDHWLPSFASPLGSGLELVPLEDATNLARGDKLHLRVVMDGRPVEGAVVSYNGDVRGASAADGHINIRLREAGLQQLTASLETPHSGPEADRTIHTSVLNFEVSAP